MFCSLAAETTEPIRTMIAGFKIVRTMVTKNGMWQHVYLESSMFRCQWMEELRQAASSIVDMLNNTSKIENQRRVS